MKIKSIHKSKDRVDYNIYTDTDSVFFEAAPLAKVDNPSIDVDSDDEMIPAILKAAKQVQDYINKMYDLMAMRMFNIESHRFDIKQETIAKAGFWVRKKRYAQWIINDNGHNCNEVDVKGLDVKRSSFPTYFKKIMNDVLYAILHNTNKEEIDEMILKYKAELESQPITEVGKNSAVKNMSKYVDRTHAIGQFAKGTPAHVKAAIAYNQLMKHFNVPSKYEPMKDGDKIKWVYLKDNPYGIKTVGLTGHNDPKVITDIVEEYIDYNKLWESELKKKLDKFYEVLNWEYPNPNKKMISKFFEF